MVPLRTFYTLEIPSSQTACCFLVTHIQSSGSRSGSPGSGGSGRKKKFWQLVCNSSAAAPAPARSRQPSPTGRRSRISPSPPFLYFAGPNSGRNKLPCCLVFVYNVKMQGNIKKPVCSLPSPSSALNRVYFQSAEFLTSTLSPQTRFFDFLFCQDISRKFTTASGSY